MGHIDYREKGVFQNIANIKFEDTYIGFRGNLRQINLFDINNSNDIGKLVIEPGLNLFRSVK